MKYNYNLIMECVKNLDDFKKLTNTVGEIAKIKFIKYIRISSLIKHNCDEKLKYVKNENYEYASLSRDKERYYMKALIKLLNIEN